MELRVKGAAVVVLGFGLAAVAQGVAVSVPAAPLLPEKFGEWVKAPMLGNGVPPIPYEMELSKLSKEALEEDGPVRSAVGAYSRPGKSIYIEAIQFGDRSGAYSAYTVAERVGMKPGKDLGKDLAAAGVLEAVGERVVLLTSSGTVVLVNGIGAEDVASLKPLVEGLPKVAGNKGAPPLLPTLAPTKGLVAESLRYALGATTYAAEGGVLPAHSLGWEKSAEAVTAQYEDKRGKETLTLLLYPTPTIAGAYTRAVQAQVVDKGAAASVRREGEVVMLAEGTFAPGEAQKMLENIHLKQVLSFDKDVQPVFHVEVQKTYSLLQNILILCGVGGLAAVLLGLFLGFGRAGIRVLQGKPAAVEVEFLSLHLAPENKAPEFGHQDAGNGLQG